MVGSDTPKTRATSFLGMPRSTAASTLSLRSLEYGFIAEVSHSDQSSRKPLQALKGTPRRQLPDFRNWRESRSAPHEYTSAQAPLSPNSALAWSVCKLPVSGMSRRGRGRYTL